MQDNDISGIVFNIQKFSVHDGEGIRTIVFLKGCPFKCLWCCNPESQNHAPERAFNASRCLGAKKCGRCAKICPTAAIQLNDDAIVINRDKCSLCGACVKGCPGGAQIIYGEKMSVSHALAKVEEDDVFYTRSGGGITLSGGECLAQPRFALSLLERAKKHGLHTAIETEGCCKWEVMKQALPLLDTLIFDIKCMDNARHRAWTGCDNRTSLDNLTNIIKNFPTQKIIIRTPVIPGFNDTPEDIMAIRNFIPKRPLIEYELLDYHRLGSTKYSYLGRKYLMKDVKCDPELMKKLRNIAQFGS